MRTSETVNAANQGNFKKGMTLDEYFSQMHNLKSMDPQSDKIDENLYQTSKFNQAARSKKIITYEIRESQQDQYNQSHDGRVSEAQNLKISGKLGSKQQRQSHKNILVNFPGVQVKASLQNHRGFRVRKQSNSPFNSHKKDQALSPNKNFAMTLFNGDWGYSKDSTNRSSNPSSTLYGKFLKGIKQPEDTKIKTHSKQKYFQKKNTQELQHILKYQKDQQQKYNKIHLPDSMDMRVEGITDRLHDRKVTSLKGHK